MLKRYMTCERSPASNTFLKLSLISAAVIAGLMLWLAFVPHHWGYKQKFEKSELIIQGAENFLEKHDRAASERELFSFMQKHNWESSESCPCYLAVNSSEFIVWFGYTTVGSSMVYYSESKTWGEEG